VVRHLAGVVLLLVLASCASNTTTLNVQALGEPGVTVWFGDMSTTLDANGHGTLVVPRLHVRTLGAFGLGAADTRLVDASEATVTLRFEQVDRFVNLFPVCIISAPSDGGPIDGADLVLRRELSTGNCFLVSPALQQNGAYLPNAYDPSRFDDQPCGPFAAR
jgi:hypothetical protein